MITSPMTTSFARGINLRMVMQPEYVTVDGINYAFAPPQRNEDENKRDMVIRILALPLAQCKEEIFRRQKELLTWRRIIRRGENSRARNKPRRRKIRAEIRWRANELLAITDAFNMKMYRDKREAYLQWKADALKVALEEVARMQEAGEAYRPPDAPLTADEELFAEREATR